MVLTALISSGCSRDFVRAKRSPLTASAHNDLGVIKKNDGNLELALDHYKIAIEQDSTWWLPCFNAAGVLFRMKLYTEALLYIEKAEELTDFNNPDVLNNHAWILHSQGHSDMALKYAQKAVRLKDDQVRLDTLRAIQSAFDKNFSEKQASVTTEDK